MFKNLVDLSPDVQSTIAWLAIIAIGVLVAFLLLVRTVFTQRARIVKANADSKIAQSQINTLQAKVNVNEQQGDLDNESMIRKMLDQATAERVALQKKVEVQAVALDQLRATTQADHDHEIEATARLHGQMDSLGSRLNLWTDRAIAAQVKVGKLETQIEQLSQALSVREQELASTKTELIAARAALLTAHNENEQLKAEVKRLEQLTTAQQADLDIMRKRLDELERQKS